MIRVFLNQDTTYICETDRDPFVEYPAHITYWPKWRSMPWLWDNAEYVPEKNSATIYVPVNTVILKFDSL